MTAPFRIAHLSDIHVDAGPVAATSLLGKRLGGYWNLHWGPRRKHYLGAAGRLTEALDQVRRLAPDLVLLSGDLTALGLASELGRARELLEPYLGMADWLVIPGNHDVYTIPDVPHQLYEQHFGDLYRADLNVEGRRTPYARFVGEALALVVCETVRANRTFWDSRGEVAPAELAALAQLMAHPELSAREVLLVTHYAPYKPNAQPDAGYHGLRNLGELLSVLRPRPPKFWLHGHIHHSYAFLDGETEFATVDSGSATHHPRRSFGLYERSDAGWVISGYSMAAGDAQLAWQKTLAGSIKAGS